MMTRYYHRDGSAMSEDELMDARTWDSDKRRIAETTIGDSRVSTVHLIIDHGFGQGPPLIFETMIFGGPYDEWCDRYSTEGDAVAGHERVVAALRNGHAPND